MMGCRVRLATKRDAIALQDIYTHLHPDDPKINEDQFEQELEALLADPDRMIIVAELDGIIVSSCTLFILPNLTRGNRPIALIENVVTHKQYRRTGLGKKVLHDAFDRAEAAGCYKVMLLTGSQTEGTHHFYQEVGLKPDKTGYHKRL
ncbi:GNAT family N-acetyltransferase [Maritalea mediterranea]|uniref:GNAT family N-acetyltransferase n=1 Tax=Maritalea mediterranea TaxID=2909667 RepID=A0ABS9E459_9HYPH|nr:GNAT family N-acetyltransferase [Maritalea mediterranea]MCF4097654.1 GNAT family N-acetyltransferase [Maritalea mediterranea]